MKTLTTRRKKLTDKWKYKSISLKNSTYSLLSDLSETMVPGMKLSNAKTVEQLILNKTQSNSSRDNKENYNDKEIKK
jgi:hypothetical protein